MKEKILNFFRTVGDFFKNLFKRKKKEPTLRRVKEGMVERRSVGGWIVDIILVLVLLLCCFICIMPMWHTFMASISDGYELLTHKELLWLPVGDANLDGYKLIFTSKEYQVLRGYINTIIYVVLSTLLGLIMNILAGYVLSRKTKFKAPIVLFFLIANMFNGGTIPTYLVIKALGMTQTMWSLIIPGCTNAMFIILAMNSFLQVPESTIEAAQLDGAGPLRIMFRVALPQGLGLILVTVINTAVGVWNSWFNALIYVPNQQDLWPLQLWIQKIVADSEGFMTSANVNYVKNTLQFVVVIISVLPMYIAFPFFIKKLEKGMVLGAVKG